MVYLLMNRKQKITQLEKKIADTKAKLLALGDLRPGSLSRQYKTCANPNCICKADPPQKHEYYQLSFTRKGKGSSSYVRKSTIQMVKQQVANYAAMKALVDQWIELSTELCVLRVAPPEK